MNHQNHKYSTNDFSVGIREVSGNLEFIGQVGKLAHQFKQGQYVELVGNALEKTVVNNLLPFAQIHDLIYQKENGRDSPVVTVTLDFFESSDDFGVSKFGWSLWKENDAQRKLYRYALQTNVRPLKIYLFAKEPTMTKDVNDNKFKLACNCVESGVIQPNKALDEPSQQMVDLLYNSFNTIHDNMDNGSVCYAIFVNKSHHKNNSYRIDDKASCVFVVLAIIKTVDGGFKIERKSGLNEELLKYFLLIFSNTISPKDSIQNLNIMKAIDWKTYFPNLFKQVNPMITENCETWDLEDDTQAYKFKHFLDALNTSGFLLHRENTTFDIFYLPSTSY